MKNNRFLRTFINFCMEKRCKDLLSRFRSHLTSGSSILDVGSGTSHMTHLLQNESMHMTPLDIVDLSFFENIKPTLYKGQTMPFQNGSFDFSLLLTMLHHCHNPEQILREASRVSHKIIIIEDVVKNPFHAMITKWLDSLLNLEFKGHPHQNKTDEEWCALFTKLGLRLIEKNSKWSFLCMWQVTYVLEKP